MHSHGQRAVVTGTGVISAVGLNCGTFWYSLLNGQSGVKPVHSFDTSNFTRHLACEIDVALPSFSIAGRRVGRTASLAALAGREALAQAQLTQWECNQTGFVIGTTMGEACWIEGWHADLVKEEADTLECEALLYSGPDQVGSDAASLLGLQREVTVIAAACAAGNYAIGRAADLVRLGRVERVLAGGADAFSRVAYTGFDRLGALAAEVCRPFSAGRDGIMLSEGAAMLLIESLASARARGAVILAEVAATGLSCDAYHIVSPHPDGTGTRRAMEQAVKQAGLCVRDIDYVCAHGTGTSANDRAEVMAVRQLFGDYRVPMSSLKAITGHSLGAASAMESVACILSLQHQTILPTWNYKGLDPECDWDVVPNAPRKCSLSVVINNANAFGGNNAAVLFRHAEEIAK